MFTQEDPRAALAAAPAAPSAGTHFAPARYAHLPGTPPAVHDATQQTWFVHAASFVVAWSEAKAGAVFEVLGAPHEHLLVLPDEAAEVEVRTPHETQRIGSRRVAILPPGDCTVTVLSGGRVIRALTRASAGPLPVTPQDRGAMDDPNVPPLMPWPAPPGGYRVRQYPMDATPVAGAYGRVWRSSSFMVLYVPPSRGARDTTKLSPHAHADFQQVNVVLEGEFEFNMRWPWVADKARWRADEHVRVAAPAVVVIPAQAIHTNERKSEGLNHVFDIYCPPRRDFSAAGWALNGDEYPMPE